MNSERGLWSVERGALWSSFICFVVVSMMKSRFILVFIMFSANNFTVCESDKSSKWKCRRNMIQIKSFDLITC